VVEGLTYRIDPHIWWDDPTSYQPVAEVEAWRLRDPLLAAAARLQALGTSAETLGQIDAAAAEDVREVFRAVVDAADATWADTLDLAVRSDLRPGPPSRALRSWRRWPGPRHSRGMCDRSRRPAGWAAPSG
jgi:TPP-dependent pyruvate/acetoin dehydrogenase alpha subunit